MVSAYNDWHIDEWAGAYPGRFIPIGDLPTWNPEAMCAEIKRVAAKGCRAVTMPELPHLEGLPSYHDLNYWGPVFQTLSDENVVMCLHIGTGFGGDLDGPRCADPQPSCWPPDFGDLRSRPVVGPGDAYLPEFEVRVL